MIPELLLHLADLAAHAFAQLRGVEVRERLVEQKDPRLAHQRPRQRDALLLAAGELGRGALCGLREADEIERLHGLFGDVLLVVVRSAADGERERNVLKDRHVRPNRVRLEDHSYRTFVRGHEDPLFVGEDETVVDLDLARGRTLQACDHAQGCRLAAAAWAEQREQLALGGLELQDVDDVPVGIAAIKPLNESAN